MRMEVSRRDQELLQMSTKMKEWTTLIFLFYAYYKAVESLGINYYTEDLSDYPFLVAQRRVPPAGAGQRLKLRPILCHAGLTY